MADLGERLQQAVGDRYTIAGEVGAGGMAVVFRAFDPRHERHVAIKVLRPELAAAVGSERFLREIRIAAQLTHPHILPLHESDAAGGLLYYTMPFAEGESLRDRLSREGQLGIDDALQILREVGSALSYAHSMGIVHRDIKPENILLVAGQAVVTDFGIARAVHEAAGDRLTESGLAVGTPHYMSPEQSLGSSQLDARSDEYALACVLYEMLAGDPPFTGSNAMAVVARHSMDPVPRLRTARGTIPETVEAAVERALAKVPADRFPTVQQFVAAATGTGAATATGGAARRTPRVPRRGLVRGLALGLAAVVVGAALWGAWKRWGGGSGPAGPSLVAVLPFEVAGPSSLEWLENDLPEVLSLEFTGVGGPRAIDRHAVQAAWTGSTDIDPRRRYEHLARTLGTDRILAGRIIAEPTGLHAVAAMLDAGTADTIATAEARGSAEAFVALAESLAVGLLVRQAGEGSRLRSVLSSSPAAVRAWLDGLTAFRSGDYLAARDRYTEAVDQDTTFALAAAGMMWAEAWLTGITPIYLRGRRLAWDHRDRLPRPDSTIFVAESYRNSYPEWIGEQRSFAKYADAVREYPDRWDVWSRYGDYLWHEGGFFVEDGTQLAIEAFQRAIALDSAGALEPWEHLSEYYAVQGDVAAFATLPRPLQEGPWKRWLIAVAREDRRFLDSARAVHRELPLDWLAGWLGALQVRGSGLEEAGPLLTILEQRARAGDADAVEPVWRYLLNRGRSAEARPFLTAETPADQRSIVWIALHWGTDPGGAEEAIARIRARLDSAATDEKSAGDRVRDLCVYAHARLETGDTSWVGRAVAGMREVWPDKQTTRICDAVLQSWQQTLAGAPTAPAAIARADSLLMIGGGGIWFQLGWRHTLVSLYERVGQPAEALRLLRMRGGFQQDFGLPAWLRTRGRLAARLGRREEAIDAYEHYLALMQGADSAYAADIDEVKTALAGLTSR